MQFNPKAHLIQIKRTNRKTGVTTSSEYLPVAWRLYWFRLEQPHGVIDSKLVHLDVEKGIAVFEAYVERDDGGSARMHGSETIADWQDFIEKAQTKALGRALAAVGFGTQFTEDDFHEGERVCDSPIALNGSKATSRQS